MCLRTTRVLIYNGQFDLNVGYVGTTKYLRQLDWPGRDAFNSAKKQVWMVDVGAYEEAVASQTTPGQGGKHKRTSKGSKRDKQGGGGGGKGMSMMMGGGGGGGEGTPTVGGYFHTAFNLTSIMVIGAGHMMPMNQPAFAFDLLDRFLNNKPFA